MDAVYEQHCGSSQVYSLCQPLLNTDSTKKRIHNELHNRAITQMIQTSGMSKMSHESDISMLVVLIIMAGLYCLCCASVWLLLLCNTLYALVWKNGYAKYLS